MQSLIKLVTQIDILRKCGSIQLQGQLDHSFPFYNRVFLTLTLKIDQCNCNSYSVIANKRNCKQVLELGNKLVNVVFGIKCYEKQQS